MSIIQDALKKASKEKSKDDAPSTQVPAHHGIGRMIVAVLFVTALIIIANYMAGNRLPALSIIPSPVTAYKEKAVNPPNRISTVRQRSGRAGDFVLSGIMQLLDGPRAIINGVVVGVGDTIGGAKVVKITGDSAVIDANDRKTVLEMED